MNPLQVGTVKGPGETPHEFLFIAPDPDRRVKHGEFVYYLATIDDEERPILGRVTDRRAVKLFPTHFWPIPACRLSRLRRCWATKAMPANSSRSR